MIPTPPFRQTRRQPRGVAALEYMLILALVVIPIALMVPIFMHMVIAYGNRMLTDLGLPFP